MLKFWLKMQKMGMKRFGAKKCAEIMLDLHTKWASLLE
jgi:hypothetical protein